MNNKTLVVGLIIVSLFITALSARNGDIAWMTLPFLAYLLAGILQAPSLEKLSFSAERHRFSGCVFVGAKQGGGGCSSFCL